MKEFTYTIQDPVGLHARPAGLFVKEAAKYTSKITISTGDKSSDAKRLFSVMGLGVKGGNRITVTAEGNDEDAAIQALQAFLENNV